MTTVTGKLIGHPDPRSVEIAAVLVDLDGVERTGYVDSLEGQIRGRVTATPNASGSWSLALTANSLIDTDWGDSLWRITEGESGDFSATASTYVSVPASGGPYWMGDLRTDPPGGAALVSTAVLSVNGETGAVVLNSSDVGAEPSGAVATHAAATDPHGDRAYADDTFVPLVGDVVGRSRVAYKSADEQVESSTTLQDDDHLNLSVAASGVYAFDAFLVFDSAEADADFKMTFAGPPGSTGSWTPLFVTLSNAAGNGSVWLAKFDLESTSAGGAIAGGATAQPSGFVFVGDTAGTLKLQWSQSGSFATPTFLRKGSWLRLHRLA